ncbi:glycosyl hydrolase [Balneola sp. EhC07]|uniref:WD40/YVTN/BNR-like repeat-containing protein n=1 Tax=Balneola sp. EhC07 TaxID=1849360 RepID=UPI0007F34844|nr:glycosyl hydrolase [Balneola sp. EhC07]OAN60421.1 glycosyl hydrolase [Balneola sp. EhC07]
MKRFTSLLALVLMISATSLFAQRSDKDSRYNIAWNSLEFRSIGPAFTSGRISDFAVNPDNHSEFYIATASGGVWKTENGGISLKPVFDNEGSYSIGFVAMDPNNHNVVWVGTGENNNQRSVAYGDGVYKSIDGGKSWKHMGLKNSEHIGMIEIDPRDSDVVYVAATGPLWSSGGDRGLYKTTDGGENWEKVLEISEHTGVNEVHMDPRDPDVLYATAHQRRRRVFTYISGGPESAVYKSTDAGKTWKKTMRGMPGGDIGRIGMDISPANPDVVYAVVEAESGKSGFYRSDDRGESWEKQSNYSSSGNYYQEVIADPVDVDLVYVMNTYSGVSEDGGKTFNNVGEKNKHIDNHALWINPDNPNHLLNGNDGGVYESFDRGKTWRFFTNLPVTQFYKVAADNAEPFYNIYGGTQDNFTLGGPSRTNATTGINDDEWFVTVLGDGFEPHVDPTNPNIVYAQSQYGGLARFDKQSGEQQNIRPQAPDADYDYNWNWDSPFFISTHDNERLYFASDRVLRSDDMGQSWREVSGDLTRQLDRNKFEVMDKVWPMDAIAKNASTSVYGSIVALAESPLDENLLYAGTDDGLVHVSEDGGETWNKYDKFPGVPDMVYVNELIASEHDINTVYVAFNNHKNGDFKPYILKSTNLGKSWKSIANNLPEKGSVYSIAEDFETGNLLFVGTEFSMFASIDGGEYWKELNKGLPTVAVRDIDIQKRENDLVLGTFGRSFYVMDDYSALQELSKEVAEKEAHLFSTRHAYQYQPYSRIAASNTISWLGPKGFQGEDYFLGENPEFGAAFTYYLKDGYKTKKAIREAEEAKKRKDGETVYYPTYEQLKAEEEEEAPFLIFTVKDANGDVVRELKTSPRKGINRIYWDLTYPQITRLNTRDADQSKDFSSGLMVLPGMYTVELSKNIDGEVTQLTEAQSFEVRSLGNVTLPAEDPEAMLAFHKQLNQLSKAANSARSAVGEAQERLQYYKGALKALGSDAPSGLASDIEQLEEKLDEINMIMFGDRLAGRLEIQRAPSLNSRINNAIGAGTSSTSDPTGTSKRVAEIAKKQLKPVIEMLKEIMNTDIPEIDNKLKGTDAPWTPGRVLEIDW